MINADKLNHLVRNKSKEHNLDFELVYRNYMFERFLERVSKSKYSDDFIVKGGFLIGSMIGVENRVTKDIDMTHKNAQIEKQTLIDIFNEISNIDCYDNVKFEFKRIEKTREQFDYPGYRISFDAVLQKTRIHLKMDISFGDIIVPKAIDYKHKCIFEDRIIQIKSYPLETVLAEKLEAIISWGIVGSRLRDYYDVYILNALYHDSIDYELLGNSLQATSLQRGTTTQLNDYKNVVKELIEDTQLHNGWLKFQNTFEYAKGLEFKETILIIEKILDEIFKVVVKAL